MKEAGIEDPNEIETVRKLGVIDLPTIQKKLNLHYSLALDLFGSEVSTNAANAFNAGLKGRYQRGPAARTTISSRTTPIRCSSWWTAEIKRVDEPALTALNMRLRDDYTDDCNEGVGALEQDRSRQTGIKFELELPHVGVPPAYRRVLATSRPTTTGELLDGAEWTQDEGRIPAVGRGRRFHRGADAAGWSSPANSRAGSRRPRSASTTSPATSNT